MEVEESRVIDKQLAGIEWARIQQSFISIGNIVLLPVDKRGRCHVPNTVY